MLVNLVSSQGNANNTRINQQSKNNINNHSGRWPERERQSCRALPLAWSPEQRITSPPNWYSYDTECEEPHYASFLMNLPEIIPDAAAPFLPPPPLPLSKLQEKKAWYWQLPPTTTREFSVSRISIRWAKAFKVCSPLALLSLTYEGKNIRFRCIWLQIMSLPFGRERHFHNATYLVNNSSLCYY